MKTLSVAVVIGLVLAGAATASEEPVVVFDVAAEGDAAVIVTVARRPGDAQGAARADVTVSVDPSADVVRKVVPARATIALTVTVFPRAAGTIGRIVRFTLRPGTLPSATRLCIPPGETKPGPC